MMLHLFESKIPHFKRKNYSFVNYVVYLNTLHLKEPYHSFYSSEEGNVL